MNYPFVRPQRLSVAEFRELEAQAPEDERWELINGVIHKSMAGGTRAHNAIVQNVTSALLVSLRRAGSPCRPYSENMRLDIDAAELSTLPDVVVTCAPVRDGAKAIDRPVAVVEVLSRSHKRTGQDRQARSLLRSAGPADDRADGARSDARGGSHADRQWLAAL